MGGKNSAPQAPNTSAISGAQTALANQQGANAKQQQEIAQQNLDWARQQGNTDQVTTDHAVNGALGQQDALNAQSSTDLNNYNGIATPALKTLQADADKYGDPYFKAQQVGGAIADQAQAGEAARNNSIASLEGYGVNPGATRFGALDIGARTANAAAEAAAGTHAGQQVDATGRQLQQNVFDDASKVGAQGINASTAGTAAGASAVGSSNATLGANASARGTGAQWTGLANGATAGQGATLAGAGNTANAAYKNQLDQFNANEKHSSGIGSLIGTVGSLALGAATGGASLPFTGAVMGAMGGADGGSASSPLAGLSRSDYGEGAGAFDRYGLSAAVGGPIANPNPDATPGGAIPAGASPTRGQATDDVPARLTVGEYVVPKDVVAWLGHKHFQSLIDKSREQAAQATAKPAVGAAPPQAPTFSSTPQGAIPMQRAA